MTQTTIGALALAALLAAPVVSAADAAGEPRAQGSEERGQAAEKHRGAAQTERKSAGTVIDVKTLNENVSGYIGRSVAVAGEIQEKLGARAFVLESGGIFDDEITVVVPKDAEGIAPRDVVEDADIVVTGKVRSAPLVEIERELDWYLDPEYEVEFEGTRTYLVAERIERQRG